jgi:hypothetical protein
MEVKIDGVLYVPAEEPPSQLPEGYLSPHFRESEFTCNHCNSLEGHSTSQELLNVLEDVRAHFGAAPITINSGYRCETHNRNVGGAPIVDIDTLMRLTSWSVRFRPAMSPTILNQKTRGDGA